MIAEGTVKVPGADGAVQWNDIPVLKVLSVAATPLMEMYWFGAPPVHVTVSPALRVTEVAVAASGGGLVITGI